MTYILSISRQLLALMLCCICFTSLAQVPCVDSMIQASPIKLAENDFLRMTQGRALSPIEGVWQLSSSCIVSIVRSSLNNYDVVLYTSDDLRISVPTKVGEMTPGARPGLYDARLARRVSDGKLSGMNSLAVTISDNGTWLEFAQYKKGIRVNLSRLIPYMFRFAVRSVDTRPDGLVGARRIYPKPYPTADNPIIL